MQHLHMPLRYVTILVLKPLRGSEIPKLDHNGFFALYTVRLVYTLYTLRLSNH